MDTSKVAIQLLLVRELSGIELRILHLVRDGRAVAYSWEKRRQSRMEVKGTAYAGPEHRSVYSDMLARTMQNLAIDRLRRTQPYQCMMRYEDFVTNPGQVLEQSLHALGAAVDSRETGEITLQPTHGLAGSDRVRLARPHAKIVLDDQWRRELPRAKAFVLSLLGMPGLRRYGYSIRLAGRADENQQRQGGR